MQQKVSYSRSYFMEQRQQNKEAPNAELKEIVKLILSQQDKEDEGLLESDRNNQQRTQRASSYNYQSKSQSLLPKNRKTTNSIDSTQNQKETIANGNINPSCLKPNKPMSIPLSQIIQNIELQNELNQQNLDKEYQLRESISLSQEQLTEITNYLKPLLAQLRTTKNKNWDKDQQQQQQQILQQMDDQSKLSLQLLASMYVDICCFQQEIRIIKLIKNRNPSSKEVVETLAQFSWLKQQNNLNLRSEEYKKITLICIKQLFYNSAYSNQTIVQFNRCNLREWTDFLLQDMQTNHIQPDRLILDEYMRLVANSS